MNFFNWLKGLFAPGNRNTTLAGVATLASVAATGYMMSTGGVPITPGTIGGMATGAATGFGLLAAKDASGTPTPPAVNKAITALGDAGVKAQELDPLYAPIKAAVEAKGEQAKIEAALHAAAAITSLGAPPAEQPVGLL